MNDKQFTERWQAVVDQANEDRRRGDGRQYRNPVEAARMGGTVPPGYDRLTGDWLGGPVRDSAGYDNTPCDPRD